MNRSKLIATFLHAAYGLAVNEVVQNKIRVYRNSRTSDPSEPEEIKGEAERVALQQYRSGPQLLLKVDSHHIDYLTQREGKKGLRAGQAVLNKINKHLGKRNLFSVLVPKVTGGYVHTASGATTQFRQWTLIVVPADRTASSADEDWYLTSIVQDQRKSDGYNTYSVLFDLVRQIVGAAKKSVRKTALDHLKIVANAKFHTDRPDGLPEGSTGGFTTQVYTPVSSVREFAEGKRKPNNMDCYTIDLDGNRVLVKDSKAKKPKSEKSKDGKVKVKKAKKLSKGKQKKLDRAAGTEQAANN